MDHISPARLAQTAQYLAILEAYFHPLDMNTFRGLLSSYKGNKINAMQFYTLVYALFHALNSLHLIPGFMHLLPEDWHNADLEWLNSKIRPAYHDVNLWKEICQRIGLPPQQVLLANVRSTDGSNVVRLQEVSASPSATVFPQPAARRMYYNNIAAPTRPTSAQLALTVGESLIEPATRTAAELDATVVQPDSLSRVFQLELNTESGSSQPQTQQGKQDFPPRVLFLHDPTKQRAFARDAAIKGTEPACDASDLNIGAGSKRTFKKRPPPIQLSHAATSEGPPFSPLTPRSPLSPICSPLTPVHPSLKISSLTSAGTSARDTVSTLDKLESPTQLATPDEAPAEMLCNTTSPKSTHFESADVEDDDEEDAEYETGD
ncbi:hypothetical protein MBLNU459_g0116t1 [Dothideomycetes sp. NU459]